jgi:hypothetical protein
MTRQPSWKKWLSEGLADSYQVIRPDMPNTMNAKYSEWKIWFEKYFRYISGNQHQDKSTLDRVMEKDKQPSQGKFILV